MLKIANLSKRFGSTAVLRDLSIELPAASVNAVTGPIGTGKTTLLRLVAGLEMPDAGAISWQDQLWSSKDVLLQPWRRPLAMVFQQPTLWPHLTVAGQLDLVLRAAKVTSRERRRRAASVLEALSVHTLARRHPFELSGGQQQCVAVARALACEPKVLLLDEPFSQMDEASRDTAWSVIRQRQVSSGAMILLVTHDRAWAARSCDSARELTPAKPNCE